MVVRALLCPSCGGPLPPNARRVVVQCPFCKVAVSDDGPVVFAANYRALLAAAEQESSDGMPRVRVAGVLYRVLGRLAQGAASDVFLAERAHPLSERVILKVLRASSDADLFEREWATLTALTTEEGAAPIEELRRLPVPVAKGRLQIGARSSDPGGPPAMVLRASSGFVNTFDDVMRAYPRGVDPRHGVWMWRRILELLACLHKSGWVHGAILPEHLLVHARDHGVMLVGWSCATRVRAPAPLPAVSDARRAFYPASLLVAAPPTPATDLAMSAFVIAAVLGGSPSGLPASVPAPLQALVRTAADPRTLPVSDAWELRGRVAAAAREAYGAPTFVPFEMP